MKALFPSIVLLAVLSACALSGCGRPQASPQNLVLISSLRTAASTRNPELLERNAALIAERYTAGAMSEEEHGTFQAILELARAENWEQAELEAFAFQKAQRPSAEQKELVSRRMLVHEH